MTRKLQTKCVRLPQTIIDMVDNHAGRHRMKDPNTGAYNFTEALIDLIYDLQEKAEELATLKATATPKQDEDRHTCPRFPDNARGLTAYQCAMFQRTTQRKCQDAKCGKLMSAIEISAFLQEKPQT